jgi:GMP synthase (glutamine-hydrolysing)
VRCVALRHVRFEDLGTFGAVLESRGWDVEYVDSIRSGNIVRAVRDPELLVILGGPRGVEEADRHPFLKQEIALAADRLRRDRPILGICLGSQIMAAALGARVAPGPAQEIGWFPIELEPGARSDPSASLLTRESSMFLHWHGDTFDLPAGAVPLARSERYERQGFRFGSNGYALQFHPEVVPEKIRRWTSGLARQLARIPGAQSSEEIEAGARLHGPAMARQASAFLESWLDRIP